MKEIHKRGTLVYCCVFVRYDKSLYLGQCVSVAACWYVLGFLDASVCVRACTFFSYFTVKDVREPLLLSGLRGMPSLQLHSPRKLSRTV